MQTLAIYRVTACRQAAALHSSLKDGLLLGIFVLTALAQESLTFRR